MDITTVSRLTEVERVALGHPATLMGWDITTPVVVVVV